MIQKIAFLGTPDISGSTLVYLVNSGYEIPIVITGEDKKRGRGSALTPSPVKVLASELGLKVSHDPTVLLDTEFDLAVVVAYGRLISGGNPGSTWCGDERMQRPGRRPSN